MAGDAFYEAYVEVVPTAKGFERALNRQISGPSGAAGTAAGGAAGVGFVGAFGKAIPIIGGVLAAAGLGDLIATAIEDGSTFQQAEGAVEQVFGELGASAVKAFAEGGADSVGQSMNDILQSSSLIGIFGKAAGLADAELVDFSTDLITLGADLAAFANTTPAEAVEALSAGLRGESEPLRKYGVLLDDATLKARALELGIYDGNGPLTQQQRILAAYAEIMAQTTDQQGQFNRESDTLAGTQARVAAAWENISTRMGIAFLPIAEKVADFVSTDLIPALEDFTDWLAKPETQKGIEDFGNAVGEVGNFAKEVGDNFSGMVGTIQGIVEFLNGDLSFDGFIQKMLELPGPWGDFYRIVGQAGGIVGLAVGTMIGTVARFAKEVGANIALAAGWFQNLPNVISGALQGAGAWLFGVGRDLIFGLVNGIKNAAGAVTRAITGVVTGAIDWAKELLGIASPSKVFAEIGEYTSQGFARGIASEYAMVRAATAGMTGAAVQGAASFNGASISGLLEIGGDGLGRIIDGRIYESNAANDRVDNAGSRRRF